MLRADVLAAWCAGVRAADARVAVERALAGPELADWRADLVIATGKAAAAMARGVAQARGFVLLPRDAPAGELPAGIEVLRADHPIPTKEGIEASSVVLAAAQALGSGQRLLYLVSGGTSALFEVPLPGVTSNSLIDIHRALFACGAPIQEMNLVRRALSQVKGGGLLAATAADVVTLAVSDVPGDDPATIGSGPTLPAQDERSAARDVLERYGLWQLAAADLKRTLNEEPQMPTPASRPSQRRDGGAHPRETRFKIVCSAKTAVAGAESELRNRGYALVEPPITCLQGGAVEAAREIASTIALRLARAHEPWGFVVAGETTLAVPPTAGRGGRNQHGAAIIASELAGREGFACVAAGTDGIDGNSDNAGAIVDGGTAARAGGALDLGAALARFDTARALEAAGEVLRTGPTGTNVGDLLVAVGAPR